MAGIARGLGRSGLLAVGLLVLAGTLAVSAVAQAPGLPRTYQVQRVDSPVRAEGANFSQGSGGVGDLNNDGEFDFVTGQLAGSPNADGQVFLMSGETGQLIDTIVAPDNGNPTNAAGNNRANFAFPWASKVGHNGDATSDLGSCPGGTSGALCSLAAIGPPDGIPEIIIGARGVDPRGIKDAGRSYVYDGATRALLKRIDQPVEDATPFAVNRAGGNWFGRVVLWPAGLPACQGNFGVGACAPLPPAAGGIPREVRNGDMDGGGRPDIVISASVNNEDSTTANPESPCGQSPGATCLGAGRVYVYRGEDIVGSSPAEILDGVGANESIRKIRSPVAQPDSAALPGAESESLGNYMTPIGDVGSCTPAPPQPEGKLCPPASRRTTPDGRPEVVVGASGVDLPFQSPDAAWLDVGAAILIDGATGAVLWTYQHPQPQAAGRFGTPNHHEPASGDLGDTALPDVALPAPNQNVGAHSSGREYIMNGNYLAGTGRISFARLDDPTPGRGENFGSGSAGVGDLVGGPGFGGNELLIGGTGPFLGASNRDTLNDLHFYNAANERTLQEVPDPDQQAGSGFGESIVALGDLNEDGFLDFMAGAWLFSGPTFVSEGRAYIFRSDNSALPPPAQPRTPATGVTPAPTTMLAGRCANRRSGTDGRDTINGTNAGDEIFGFGGDDTVNGLPGEDCVDAGSGDDRLGGGDGRDSLLGQSGNDRASGGAGNDRLFGGDGRDRLSGGPGRDVIVGGDGGDRIRGGSGRRHRLFGEGGNDRIVAGTGGPNVIDAGSGRDAIDAANGRRDKIDCGSGEDSVRVDRADVVVDCERVRRRR